ncbi:hypothetical protein F511_37463 [Dorcoceras hygrometricum]|uniref:Uncharacterized protein n=1 Tax=Dorcoceras hygrometricum TaxID=472368 RepID=A0A2Z7AH60_9LAMI|nr:hypothetical protein F511_37463 [Dorcoceras hygrometricum]
MKRRRVEESADGLREQSQESAGSLYIQTQKKRRRRGDIQSQATVHQQIFPSKHDDVKLVYVVSHTVEAVVHLWSLGVLTAAGCGIGSVHAVVRSNLLVESSEVEEGEIHTVEAVVHLWSLGVLTAAGCGIESVHAVVRSNLLVEPSEVEEGEM